MSNRAWFYASGGKQYGPCPEAQLREFIARGAVTAATLVWTEGMANWQKAGEIPGLISGDASPHALPQAGASVMNGGALIARPLSAEFGVWALFGRALLYLIGLLLVIPLPWLVTGIYRWLVAHLRVPQRPDAAFTGHPGDIWYVFVILALCGYAGLSRVQYIGLISVFDRGGSFLDGCQMVRRERQSPDGQQRPLTFTGSIWVYAGWYLLSFISFITIIGWAWALTAWLRWMCRNVDGTRREITFNASGWQMLWRTLLFSVAMVLIIPIPWALSWYVRWNVSQVALVERTA